MNPFYGRPSNKRERSFPNRACHLYFVFFHAIRNPRTILGPRGFFFEKSAKLWRCFDLKKRLKSYYRTSQNNPLSKMEEGKVQIFLCALSFNRFQKNFFEIFFAAETYPIMDGWRNAGLGANGLYGSVLIWSSVFKSMPETLWNRCMDGDRPCVATVWHPMKTTGWTARGKAELHSRSEKFQPNSPTQRKQHTKNEADGVSFSWLARGFVDQYSRWNFAFTENLARKWASTVVS